MSLISRGSMRTYTTAMLCCTVFFLFADQNLLAPNLSAIADDFNMSESERDEKLGGYIAFGFFIVGGPVALLVGYFADTSNRPILFGLVVAFGETACLLTYWVQNYGQLFACRVLTGISIGGATPIIFSMLGDLYPEESRIYVSTLVGVALTAGIAGGQLLAGLVGPALGWRAPFLFVAVPALICALLVFFTVSDPVRGDQEQETRKLREQGTTFRQTAGPLLPRLSSDSSGYVVIGSPHKTHDAPTWYFRLEQREGSMDRQNSVSETPTRSAAVSNDQNSGTTIDLDTFIDNSDHYSVDIEHFSPEPSVAPMTAASAETTTTTTTTMTRQRTYSVESAASAADIGHLDYAERIDCQKVLKLFSTRSVAIIFIQGFPGCLPWGMIYVFLNDYFSNDRGMSVEAATAALTCFGVGGLVGQFFGGWAGQRLYNWDPRSQCVLMGGTTLISVLPMLYLLNTSSVGDTGFYFMAIVAGFLVSMNGPNVRVVLQNVCIPEVRGTAFAVFSLTDDIGKGLGPALVVLFIKACNGNRRTAFNIVVLFWLFCGALLLVLTQTVIADEAAVQRSVRAALESAALDPQQMGDTEHNPLGIHLLGSPTPLLPSVAREAEKERDMQGVATSTPYDSI